MGCKSVDIGQATKMKVLKGNPNGTDYVNYEVSVTSDVDFTIEKLHFKGKDKPINFYYKDKATGKSSYDLLNPFPKGSYALLFKVEGIEKFEVTDYIIITYSVDGKTNLQELMVTPIVNPKMNR
ncbi:MAG: hypothetical protein CMB99_15215 [Flavobacteriaceae bacterium]|nr:hypothetical protein [Flavobacteriaceae bacterium]